MGVLDQLNNFLFNRSKKNSFHVSHRLKGPKRLEGESFKDYRERLKYEDTLLKEYRKGDMLWCAKAYRSMQIGTKANGEPISIMVLDSERSQGTYIKERDGILQSFREAK